MRLAILGGLVLLSGCAVNGYEKYYVPSSNAESFKASPVYVKSQSDPKIYVHSNDINADALRLEEDGYVLVGTSSFFGPERIGTRADAIEQGKKVGAAIIMIKSTYRDTVTGSLPYTVPNAPQVATVNTSGTVYGNSGSGSYNSTSTVTMPGGSTTYNIPYSVTRSDFFPSYWVASDPNKMRLGVNAISLPDEVRRRLMRNTGAYVVVVIRGTPAFRANVLNGDVIVKINDTDVMDGPSFINQLTPVAGETIKLDIIRGAEPVIIQVKLNPNPPGQK